MSSVIITDDVVAHRALFAGQSAGDVRLSAFELLNILFLTSSGGTVLRFTGFTDFSVSDCVLHGNENDRLLSNEIDCRECFIEEHHIDRRPRINWRGVWSAACRGSDDRQQEQVSDGQAALSLLSADSVASVIQ